MPGCGLRHVKHVGRRLVGIIADATDRKARRVEQTVGRHQTVAAARSQVSDRVLLSGLDVDVSRTIRTQEQQVLSADRIIAAASTEQRGPADQIPGADIVGMPGLVDERLWPED